MKFATCNWGLCLAGLLAIFAAPAAAEWPQTSYNPSPLDGDLVLPMPCGGQMTFRRVAVPVAGILDDYRVGLGSHDQERGYLEYRWKSWLAGSFTDSQNAGTQFYYIGKYEVSRLQMSALGSECPKVGDESLEEPATRITWSEASLFAERFSDWLIRNHLDAVPKEGEVPGFFRLPTETEWEFAARGGLKVEPNGFDKRVPFAPGDIDNHVVHDGNSYKAIDLIGTREANPLGLHDMLGNAAELTLDPFRLNVISHLHGRAGGYVIRGGSYRTRKGDIRSSHRDEFTPVGLQGLQRLDYVGFRLVLVAPALPTREGLSDTQKAWEALPEEELVEPAGGGDATLADESDDPVKEARALAKAAPTPEMKRRLDNLSEVIAESVKTRNEQRNRAIRELLHNASVTANLLADDINRLNFLQELVDASPTEDLKKKSEKRRQRSVDTFYENLAYYMARLPPLSDDYGRALLRRQAQVQSVIYGQNGQQRLAVALPVVLDHVEVNRRLGPDGQSTILESLNGLAASKN